MALRTVTLAAPIASSVQAVCTALTLPSRISGFHERTNWFVGLSELAFPVVCALFFKTLYARQQPK